MRPKLIPAYFLILIIMLAASCRVHNRMFQTDHDYVVDSLRQIETTDKNYVIQKNDYISIRVYTNGGEKIVDPTSELQNIRQTGSQEKMIPNYLVRQNGFVKCPMVGDIYLCGLTLFEADSLLELEYSRFYEDVFVYTKLSNKRMIVMGPLGGKIVPLENENISVIEAIAIYGGIPENGKSYNIKLIRGSTSNPDVQIIDLSTIEGMRKANLEVRPNDIVYIEPRKVIFQNVRDVTQIVSIFTSILTLLIILNSQR